MTAAASMHRTVTFAAPLDARRTWSILQRGGGDPAFRHLGATMWRTSRMETGPVTVAVEQTDSRTVEADAWGSGAEEMLATLPRSLGNDDDASQFVPAHPSVADAHRRFPGLRVPRTGRLLEALIAAVIEQRVVGMDAMAAWRRLLVRHGDPAPGPAPPGMRVFPTAETWAALPSWEWHQAGVDPQRYRTAHACARVGAQLERVASEHEDDRSAVYPRCAASPRRPPGRPPKPDSAPSVTPMRCRSATSISAIWSMISRGRPPLARRRRDRRGLRTCPPPAVSRRAAARAEPARPHGAPRAAGLARRPPLLRLEGDGVQFVHWMTDSTLPAGSLNQAMSAPRRSSHRARPAESKPSYCKNSTPFSRRSLTAAWTSSTGRFSTVNVAGWWSSLVYMSTRVSPSRAS